MNAPLTQAQSRQLAAATQPAAPVTMGFFDLASFEFMQRAANLFSNSSMVPTAYQATVVKGYGKNQKVEENPAALSNCVVALDMAQRMNANPLMIMQNLHIIEGRPSWSSQFIIAAIIDGKPFVPMKPICDNIGLDWEAQRQRIQRHPVLNSTACMTQVVAEDGKQREMLCLPLGMLNGWLFGVDVNRVKPALRDKLMDYQRECFDVLFQHFMPRMEAALQASANDYTRISPAQAQALSELVIAETKRTGKHYKTVWGSFNRHFRVNSYHELPAARFDEACKWLGGERIKASPSPAIDYELPAVDFDFMRTMNDGLCDPKPINTAVRAVAQQMSWKLAAEAQVGILQFLERFIAYRTNDAMRQDVSCVAPMLEKLTLSHCLAYRFFEELDRARQMAGLMQQMANTCVNSIQQRMGTVFA